MAEQTAAGGYLTETTEAGSVPPGLQDFLGKAEEAVRRRNYGYALAMYRRILADMPGNLWVRKRLRGTELKRDQEGKPPNPVVGTLIGLPTLVKIVFTGLFRKHVAVMNACETFLARVPTSVWVLSKLSRAAEKLGFLETAIFSLENALEVKHNNVGVLVRLGELYATAKRSAKAAQCMQVASNLRPNDRDLAKKANDMAATKTIADSRLDDDDADYTDSLADAEKTEELARETRVEKTEDDQQRLIRRYTGQVEENPEDPNAVRRLAAAYRSAEEWENASTWYQRAAELEPKDFDIKVQIAEMRRKQFRKVISEGKQALANDPENEGTRQKLAQVQQAFVEFELNDYRQRVAAYPTNLDLKYELGIRLFDRDDMREAIQQFQQSVRSAKHGRMSRVMLGRCFLNDDKPDLAKDQFLMAMKGKDVLDDQEALTIYYYLGEAQEALGDYAGAVDSYGQIYSVDITFRDVSDRLERVRARQRGESQTPTGTESPSM